MCWFEGAVEEFRFTENPLRTAYSYYAYFEWSLILFDVLFDAVTEKELKEAGVFVSISMNCFWDQY